MARSLTPGLCLPCLFVISFPHWDSRRGMLSCCRCTNMRRSVFVPCEIWKTLTCLLLLLWWIDIMCRYDSQLWPLNRCYRRRWVGLTGTRYGRSFIGPLTPKGNEGQSRGFGSSEGRIGCLNKGETMINLRRSPGTLSQTQSNVAVVLRQLKKQEGRIAKQSLWSTPLL